MKTLLKKGTRQINQKEREECIKNWGNIAYSTPSYKTHAQNNAINMNEIFHSKPSKTIP